VRRRGELTGRYEADEIDPTRMKEEESDGEEDDDWEDVGQEEEADYVILSKSLR
jgi:hypothetical protein